MQSHATTTVAGETEVPVGDPMVYKVQRWLNETYRVRAGAQWITVPETGRTGWSTVYGLTRALQRELGIATLSNNFGDGTLAALTTQFPAIGPSTVASDPAKLERIVTIIQGGLYCKGYDAKGLDGVYGTGCATAVAALRSDMGLPSATAMVPKVLKAMLTMDTHTLLPGGTAAARSVQQWLNATYLSRKNFFVMPCDGLYSRNVQKALVLALQFELKMTDAEANGTFGPGTRAGLRSSGVFTVGREDVGSGRWVRLFHAALIFNKEVLPFDARFTTEDSAVVTRFQRFCELEPTGDADYQTWCSLLVSNGDPLRAGKACDGITEVTGARASALFGAGYRYVGRYLTNSSGSQLNKKIQPGEIKTILDAGLRIFPIYQTYGGASSYFSRAQGEADAEAAFVAARGLGFLHGTVIYFAVDYDAQDTEIDSAVVPYFEAISKALADLGHPYRVGIYGSRNVCSRVSEQGFARYSFVSGMSTGFSGNLGYTLPDNWSFDQISTTVVGAGTGRIEIDNNIASERDFGQSAVQVRAVHDVALPVDQIPDYSGFMHDYVEWFAKATTFWQDVAITHNPEDVFLSTLRAHDGLFTTLARGYGMRKSLIETVVLWESSVENVLDAGKDAAVFGTYAYLEMKEGWDALSAIEKALVPAPRPPLLFERDCSTGVAQIFSRVAAEVLDWARARGLWDEPGYDIDDWHQQRDLWMRLRDDDEFSIRVAALVLLWSAWDVGIVTSDPASFTDDEVRRTLARYNGVTAEATKYGQQNFGLYSLLETRLNKPARDGVS